MKYFYQTKKVNVGCIVPPIRVPSLFRQNRLHIVYESANNDRNAAVYLLAVATRNPDPIPLTNCDPGKLI